MFYKYYRLVCFVVNICPELLRKIFLKLANADMSAPYTSLEAYLATKKAYIKRLILTRQIRDQFDLLYPSNGDVDESKWDVTILITLILELFERRLKPMDQFYLKEIREIRNSIQHLPNTTHMSDEDFDDKWDRLETAAMALAKQEFDSKNSVSFQKKISHTKTNHFPDVDDTLRIWHDETIKEKNYKLAEMENKLNTVEMNSRETVTTLRNVTVHKPGPEGKGSKRPRIMVADGILNHLKVSFASTMKELPENFCAPAEVADIRTKLRDKHYVVVTGSYNSRYFETALSAINGMDYNFGRCVEMLKSSDWRHVDPDDVDFILCRDPFGIMSYDKHKAKSMADILNSMLCTAKGDDGKTIDILLVTDYTVLTECKQYHDHDILDEVVKIFDETTEAEPADLTLSCGSQHIDSSCLSHANNLPLLTSNFLEQYSMPSRHVDKGVLHAVRAKFKEKKVVVITGPKHCGKTSVAVAVASYYQPSQCLLLTDPDDVKNIDFQNVCLVIIDEFTGKYRYETNRVYRWFEMFDHLDAAVSAGQMNVVITCEDGKLEKCCNEIVEHPILKHRIELTTCSIQIKQEDTDDVDKNQIRRGLKRLKSPAGLRSVETTNRLLPKGQRVWSVKGQRKSKIKVKGDKKKCVFSGCCMLPTGEILLTDFENKRLKKFDGNFQLIRVCELPQCPHDVCSIGKNEAVLGLFGCTLQFVDVSGNMALKHSVKTKKYL